MPTALGGTANAGIVRSSGTIGCYLVLAFFTFMLTLQGTIAPFLKTDLNLSYRTVGLHASAIAIGAILVGLVGDRAVRRHGRRQVLMLGVFGCVAGAVLLALAPGPAVSIAGCALIGIGGSFLPTIAFAILADLHGARRSLVINEAAALNYAFAMLAPLLTGFCVWLTLGWRGAVPISAPIGGLFPLGTGVSLLFPLTVSLALGAAGPASDAASARSTIAFGVALLTMPVMLGGLADHAGLRNAHWLVPILILATLVAFGFGQMLDRG
jgi:MFS family permease